MTVEKRLENALSISENIKDGKICPNNLYDLQLHLSDALEQVKKLTIPVVVQAKPEKVCDHIFKKRYGRSGGEKCIKCGKII